MAPKRPALLHRALAFALLGGVLAVGGVIAFLFQRDPVVRPLDGAPASTPTALARQAEPDTFDPTSSAAMDEVESNPSRAPTPTTAPGRVELRKVRGATIRADSKMPVRCVFRAYDDAGVGCTVQRAQKDAFVFDLSVDANATRLEVEAADAFDLDSVTLPLRRGDVTALTVELPLAKGSIQGVVVDETGAGVAGVRVRMNYGRAGRSTRQDGRFVFAPVRDDSYAIGLDPEAFSSLGSAKSEQVDVVDGIQVTPLTFSVRRGSTLRVRIVDDLTDAPLGGIAVGVVDSSGRDARRAVASAADGIAEIHHLVAGAYDVSARPTKPGMSRATTRIDDLGESEVRTIELRITRGAGDVSGIVEDADGSPQPFARVIAQPEAGSAGTHAQARANSDGTFVFRALPPGTYRVLVEPEYCRTYNWLPSSTEPIEVTGGTVAKTRVLLRHGARIDGILISGSRRGALNARMYGTDDTRECPIADGRFAFSGLQPGVYRVEIVDPSNGDGAVLHSGSIQLAAGATERLRVELP